jgi:glycosyltransferase involved in cell wall biosynthesis
MEVACLMAAVTVIIPCRNKAAHVGRCVQSFLDQTVDDFQLIISDQGSEDGSAVEIALTLAAYGGSKKVDFMRCPETEYRGHAGLDAHLNWLHQHITGDLVIMCSADDFVHPQRVERTRWAFETFNPSYVSTRLEYKTPEGAYAGETGFPDRCSRWIAPAECFKYLIGSSGSSTWSRDLFEKYGPLAGIEGQDMVLPAMALMERGIYYLDEPLHYYVKHASLDNTGTGGMLAAAVDERQEKQLYELNAFHYLHHWMSIYRRLQRFEHMGRLSTDAQGELMNQVVNAANQLITAREVLTMERIEPLGMRA